MVRIKACTAEGPTFFNRITRINGLDSTNEKTVLNPDV